jgi:hypothetical protein
MFSLVSLSFTISSYVIFMFVITPIELMNLAWHIVIPRTFRWTELVSLWQDERTSMVCEVGCGRLSGGASMACEVGCGCLGRGAAMTCEGRCSHRGGGTGSDEKRDGWRPVRARSFDSWFFRSTSMAHNPAAGCWRRRPAMSWRVRCWVADGGRRARQYTGGAGADEQGEARCWAPPLDGEGARAGR